MITDLSKYTFGSLVDDITGYEGFIYIITNKKENNKFYIGKKSFNRGSNWKIYKSSCKELTDDIKRLGISNFSFRILKLCKTKTQLTYSEYKYQFQFSCLEVESSRCYNNNIGGKFYRGKI